MEKQSKSCDSSARTIVIGLGNLILGDDGVGWHIVSASQALCENRIDPEQVSFECSSAGGLALMERMVGYERAIITDSVVTAERRVGAIHSKPLHLFPNWGSAHSSSIHDTTLHTALKAGQRMGLSLPSEIWVVAVETEPSFTFSEDLSPLVAAAVPEAARLVKERLLEQP